MLWRQLRSPVRPGKSTAFEQAPATERQSISRLKTRRIPWQTSFALEAISIVQNAQEVKAEVAKLAGESRGRMEESLHLLSRIGISLESDLH